MNYLSGIKTQLSSLVVTFMIGATLLWLTNLFYYTPSCVLAAIVISAALSLIDVAEPIYLIRVREFIDLFCYCVVVIITLLLGPGKKLARFYSTLHYTTLHHTTLHYTTLHYTTPPHYTTPLHYHTKPKTKKRD